MSKQLPRLADNLASAIGDYTQFIDMLDFKDPANLLYVADDMTPEQIVGRPVESANLALDMLKSIIVRGRHNNNEKYSRGEAVRNAAAAILRFMRYGVSEHLLSGWQVKRIRESPGMTIQYGSLERGVTNRGTVCRSCAQTMPKGTPVLKFYWDFKGCGSWTANAVAIHDYECPNKQDAVGDV